MMPYAERIFGLHDDFLCFGLCRDVLQGGLPADHRAKVVVVPKVNAAVHS